jgi:MoxR-like ATPase
MQSTSNIDGSLQISNEEYVKWSKEIDKVVIPGNIFEIIHVIRSYIDEHNSNLSNKEEIIYISDRRWKKIIRLLRTSAFFNERGEIDVMDCLLIKHCIWNDVDHIEHTNKFVEEAMRNYGHVAMINVSSIQKEISDFEQDIKKNTVVKQTNVGNQLYIKDNCYYIVGYPHKPRIPIEIYDKLTTVNQQINIEITEGGFVKPWGPIPARINKPNHIVLDYSNEYPLETVHGMQRVEMIKAPNANIIKQWNTVYSELVKKIETLKKQNVPAEQNTKNIFFNPVNVGLHESIINASHQMEELLVELNRIRFTYENIVSKK